MSATGNPVGYVSVIRLTPEDEASLFAMPVDDRQFGVFVFTQREFAEEFARTFPDMPTSATIAIVEATELPRVLTEQARLGRTHVVTDPIFGSPTYLDQRTLTIEEYLRRLGQ